MFFLKSPVPLWFLAGGGPLGSSLEVSVSVTYQISASVGELNSVDIDLSALAFGTSANLAENDPGSPSVSLPFVSVQIGIDLDDNAFSTIDLKASITPVFVIDQSGQVSASATFDLTASASITASIGVDVVPSVSYQVSASLTAELLIADNICVSVDYRLSVAPLVDLQVQTGLLEKNVPAAYGLSASITPVVAIVNQGGLVWSMKKQKYIAVRVGDIPT